MISLSLSNDNTIKLTRYEVPAKRYVYVGSSHVYDKKEVELRRLNVSDYMRHYKNFEKSLRRTRKTIDNLIAWNKFDYFVTITFNRSYVNASDAQEVHKTFKNIIKRLKYHFGNIFYLQVAEFHSDKENIHYHLLLKSLKPLKLKYKGRTKRGNPLYTITTDFYKEDCFITVSKLNGSDIHAKSYIQKYLTKNNDYPLGRRYGASVGLSRVRRVSSRSFNCEDSVFDELVAGLSLPFVSSGAWYDTVKISACDSAPCALGLPQSHIKDEIQHVYNELLGFLLKYDNPLS